MKKREKMKEKRRDKMKKKSEDERENEREAFFFKKKVSRPSNPPGELAQNVSKKKKTVGRIIPPFFLRKFRI